MEIKYFWRVPPVNESINIEGSAYIVEENGRKKLFIINGRYPNPSIEISDIKERVNVDFYIDNGAMLSEKCLENRKSLTLDKSRDYLKLVFDFMKNRLQISEEFRKKYQGLPDEVTLDYFRRLRGVNTIEEALLAGNIILINNLEQYQPTASNTNNDILLNYDGHYSSLPIISINGQRYLFDSAGNLHQDTSGIIRDEIASKFPGIISSQSFWFGLSKPQ